MADLFNIMKVTVTEDALTARVLVNPGCPVRTAEDIEATARVYYLAPAIAQHVCLGDAGERFQDCMGDTEVAHLLEHLTVEIMNATGLAGDISCGKTRAVPDDPRLFEITLSCPDDALTLGALSSAAFMMQWAFLHPDTPAPDFEGTVAALRQLVLSLRGEDGAEGAASTEDAEDAEAAADAADEDTAPSGPIDVEGAAPAAGDADDAAQPVFGGAAARDASVPL